MKKITTDQVISICSILASVLVMVFKNETTSEGSIIIYSIFAILIIGYLVYFLYHYFKSNRALGSASIINNSKKFVKKLYKLAKENEKQLKKFSFFYEQKKIERKSRNIINKYMRKDKYRTDNLSQKCNEKKLKLEKEIKEFTRKRSENYSDLSALQAYNGMCKVMSPTLLEKNYKISQNIIKRIFDMNRILLQLEQHNYRIKFGKYVAYFAVDEEQEIKAYMDLIGWSYILMGNKKGYDAINHAINIIENRIGKDLNPTAPEGISQEMYENYLFLKARAYRHLGSTYYTFKNVDSEFYCNQALKVLETLQLSGFEERRKSDYDNMMFGVKNNYYLHQLYEFISNTRKGHGDTGELLVALDKVNDALDRIREMPKEKQDNHRILKLLSLKCQITKALSIVSDTKMDIPEMEKSLKIIESTLSKNIYFDDAMEVYSNQKVQLVLEETKSILTTID